MWDSHVAKETMWEQFLVSLSTALLKTEITNIHGPQKINPSDNDDPMALLLVAN